MPKVRLIKPFKEFAVGDEPEVSMERAERMLSAGIAVLVRPPNPLSGISFASDDAMKAAGLAGLSAASFDGVTPSSPRGFTKADVRMVSERESK